MLTFSILFLIFCNKTLSEAPLLDTVEETQHANCKITTPDIKTSANATIRRQLKGVCTTKHIEYRFKQLEKKLILELNQIKLMLGNKSPDLVTTDDFFNYDEKSLSSKIESVDEIRNYESSWSRSEIERLNNTEYSLKGVRVYSLYWTLEKIQEFEEKNFIKIILGNYDLQLEISPEIGVVKYLNLKLNSKATFKLKHRFTILEPLDPSKDINSPTFLGITNENIYRVPFAKLEERHYIQHGAIILKLTIFLD